MHFLQVTPIKISQHLAVTIIMSPRVCVLGAGIIGLSCAVRLQEVLGHRCLITVVADKFGKETTSAIAAGCFRPQDAAPVSGYTGRRSAVGKDIVLLSYNQYTSILHSEEAEEAGVHKLTGYHIRYPLVGKEPFYATFLEKCRKLSESEILSVFPSLPHGCSGHLLTTLVVSPNKYMPWLAKRFISNCGKSIKRRVESFCEMWDEYDIIVNCTGLSAGQLTGDPSIVPSRGQVMRVDNSSGKHTFAYIDNGTERMPYYIWTPDYTVIGGTKLIGCTDSRVSKMTMTL
ncbi:DDO [Bugula neritina]|uniref:DDO n=1 Tax=Bugula neritina TaxID=10212 RepID=A0A7J7K0X6_BUGNE|nr:DDO [Bugula neritina]